MNYVIEDARLIEEMKKAEALQQHLVARLAPGSMESATARLVREHQQEALRIVTRRRLMEAVMDFVPYCESPRLRNRAHSFYAHAAVVDQSRGRK